MFSCPTNLIRAMIKEVPLANDQRMVKDVNNDKLNKVLNEGNKNIKPEQGSNYFKFYVGQGNSHPTIRQIIKRRSWWHR